MVLPMSTTSHFREKRLLLFWVGCDSKVVFSMSASDSKPLVLGQQIGRSARKDHAFDPLHNWQGIGH